MYYREPQQILVLDHLAYQQQHDKKQETDIFPKSISIPMESKYA